MQGAWLQPGCHLDLIGLARGAAGGRRSTDERTVFKSVGTALEDLAAAMLVLRSTGG